MEKGSDPFVLPTPIMDQYRASRAKGLAFATQAAARGDYVLACTNHSYAVSSSMLLALAEWRLGTADPSSYLHQAVADCRELMKHFDRVTHLAHRSGNMLAVWDAMYAQLLLDEPIDDAFRGACHISDEERALPTTYKDYWVHPWDSLVLELVETGGKPAEWDSFVAWLKTKGGGSNYIKTMQAYLGLIEAARRGDDAHLRQSLSQAEKCYKARRPMPTTFGGGELAEQLVDHRLACAIKAAERLAPPGITPIESVHRWRWGACQT